MIKVITLCYNYIFLIYYSVVADVLKHHLIYDITGISLPLPFFVIILNNIKIFRKLFFLIKSYDIMEVQMKRRKSIW